MDGGQTWTRLKEGLPKEDMGRIGLAIPVGAGDTVYATVEAANKAGGFFRSTRWRPPSVIKRAVRGG